MKVCKICKVEKAPEDYRRGYAKCRSCMKRAEAVQRAADGIPVRKRRIVTEDGQVCTTCNIHKAYEEYHIGQYRCKPCALNWHVEQRRAEGIRPRSYIGCEEIRECLNCKQCKPLSEYPSYTRAGTGDSKICRKCNKIKAYAKHRENNLESVRAQRRLASFKRRNIKRGVDDGTVTKELVEELYSREYCEYCKQVVERKERTVEHILALANGGLHSASNLTMACRSCNCTKRHKPLEVFLKELNASISHCN